ncbi:DUF3857 domain-containing transglutaminase family protein [Sphingomonas sp. NPDC079357]|uniref:DUF3857 domain-containing transglutaminase family protein n=1 Tax=Sphingomonas sp. NPDC079357 TaxID=3364518 RepID=UPI00384D8028
MNRWVAWGAAGASMVVASAVSGQAKEAVRDVRYAPVPGWVIAPPPASTAPVPPGAPMRIVYVDQQVRLVPGGSESFEAYRIKVLAPEALAIGNLTIAWSPGSDVLTVHRLQIVRDGKPIDVLASQKFAILQRESNLEQSMLDGQLTAALQASGLQVGDELEFAFTRASRDAAWGERPEGGMQFPIMGMRGSWRWRLLQPAGQKVKVSTIGDLPAPTVEEAGSLIDRRYSLSDPASAVLPEQAPPRFAMTRVVQFSGYDDWRTVSRTFAPLYTRAAALGATSPVRQEAARIAAETSDPARRVEAALRAVEDRIRYVYVGLDGGNYRPAAADDTWQRRFGDCKAKTALLIALLNELGIAAEPVLVSSNGGDGIDERLPTAGAFDHVIVRATVGAAPHWLDATRLGDRHLADLPPPASRWALPLRIEGAPLEALPATPPRFPDRIEAIDIDASAGFDKPGIFRAQHVLRGDEIFAIRAQLAGVADADAQRAVATYWRQQLPDVEPTTTTWKFDDENRLLVLAMTGTGKVDWEGDAREGHTHYVYYAGYTPPNELKRPKDQPQDAPWATDYPSFTCYSATVKVPAAGKGFHWSFSSRPVDRMLGGVTYWRIATFENDVVHVTRTRRTDVRELSATQARDLNNAIAKFDNNKAYVFETRGTPAVDVAPKGSDFGSFAAFAGPNPPCQRPVATAK